MWRKCQYFPQWLRLFTIIDNCTLDLKNNDIKDLKSSFQFGAFTRKTSYVENNDHRSFILDKDLIRWIVIDWKIAKNKPPNIF